jgi:hypothetical protein
MKKGIKMRDYDTDTVAILGRLLNYCCDLSKGCSKVIYSSVDEVQI